MDAKITLSFDAEIIQKAKEYANENNISLSRLTEYLYAQLTSKSYVALEDLPISEWVNQVAEGPAEYVAKAKKRKDLRAAYFTSKKK